MHGFIQFPIIIAITLFSALSIFINSNNLAGLIGETNSIESQVNSLRFPSDIEYALSKYDDKKDELYKSSLRTAWENAAKAKQASAEIKKIVSSTGFSLINNVPKLSIDLSIYDREPEIRAYFDEAVQNAYQTLNGLVNLLESDKRELDLFGADNANFSRSQIFDELSDSLSYLDYEIIDYGSGTSIEADPCDLEAIKYKTACIIRKVKFSKTLQANDAIFVYNQIVGYPGPSLLNDYFGYHSNLTSLMLQMRNDYNDSVSDFNQKISALEEKLGGLDAEKIYLVKQDITDTITSQAEGTLSITAGRGSSLSEKFNSFKGELEQLSLEKDLAERLFAQKQDDYLFLSAESTRRLNSELSELLSLTDSLRNGLISLRDKAKTVYNELLQKNEQRKTTQLYLSALELGNRAEGKTMGESISDYSAAINYLLFIQNSDQNALALDSSFNYLSKVVKSLDGFGIDVSYEQDQLSRLTQIDDKSLYPSVYLATQELVSKLESKADFGLRKLYDLRDKITAYFADYNSFLEDPSISQKLDRDKIDGYEKYFDGSLSSDELSNLDELYTKYYEIEKYLRQKFNSIASGYLSGFIDYSYDFLESPRCLNFTRARILLSVKNPTSVTFSNVTLSKKLDIATDLENPIFFTISSIQPGEIKYKEFQANILYNCSENRSDANFTVNQTQIDKRFFELNNRLVQFCLLKDCSGIKKLYKEAYSKNNITIIEEALSDEITAYLAQFKGKDVKSRLDRIDGLLKEFNKAVDSDVGFEYNTTLVFSSTDYSQANSDYKSLKSIYNLLTPISFSSKSPDNQFEELVGRFSPQDITDFLDNTASLEDYLNVSLDSMKIVAKTALLSAKENIMKSKQGSDYLKKALTAYNNGNYNKAVLFAGLVPNQRTEETDFTYLIYIALAGILSLFCIFLIRRPKEEKKVMRHLLHAT
jgi:hypothetical protein